MPLPYFSLIITSFNEGNWLQKTVDSIMNDHSCTDFELIIVNDGSTDDSFDFLSTSPYKEHCTKLTIKVIQGHDLGVARGRNRGAEEAQGTIFIFLDAHMEVVPGWLTQIKNALQEHPHIDLLGIGVYDISNPGDIYGGNFYTNKDSTMLNPGWIVRDKNRYPGLTKVPFINASNFIIRKIVFHATGGFPSYIQQWGPEDRSLCILAYYLGYNTYFAPYITIGHHFKTQNTPEEIKKKEHVYYNILASAYLFYPKSYFERVKNRIRIWGALESAESSFREEHAEIKKYMHLIQTKRQRSFQDFKKEFSDFLDYFYVDEYTEGLVLIRDQQKKALSHFKKSLSLTQSTADFTKEHFHMSVFIRMAQIYVSQGDMVNAYKYIDRALSLDPNFIPAIIQKVKILFHEGKFTQILSYLLAMEGLLGLKDERYWKSALFEDITLLSLEQELYDYIAIAYFYSGHYQQAVDYGKKILDAFPDTERHIKNYELYQKTWENACKMRET